MEILIGLVGLTAFASLFVGTALGIVFGGFLMGFKIFLASLLIFIFCLIVDGIK